MRHIYFGTVPGCTLDELLKAVYAKYWWLRFVLPYSWLRDYCDCFIQTQIDIIRPVVDQAAMYNPDEAYIATGYKTTEVTHV
jgi:hypothetical protein